MKKIFICILILCFLVPSILVSLRDDVKDPVVALVENQKIYQSSFNDFYNNKLYEIKKNFTEVDDAYLKSDFLKNIILNKFVNDKVIEYFITNSKLNISDNLIISIIKKFPYFQNDDKNFSREKFELFLQQSKLKESEYIISLKKEVIKMILFFPLNKIGESDLMVVAQNVYEQRFATKTVNIVGMPLNANINIEKPEETELEDFYFKNKDLFILPEYRKVQILKLNEKDLEVSISKKEILAEFNNLKIDHSVDITFLFTDEREFLNAYNDVQNNSSNIYKYKNVQKIEKLTPLFKDKTLPGYDFYEQIKDVKVGEVKVITTNLGKYIILLNKKEKLTIDLKQALLNKVKNELLLVKKQKMMEEVLSELSAKINYGEQFFKIKEKYNKIVNFSELNFIDSNGKFENSTQCNIDKFLLKEIFSLKIDESKEIINESQTCFVKVILIKPTHLPEFAKIKEKVVLSFVNNKKRAVLKEILKDREKYTKNFVNISFDTKYYPEAFVLDVIDKKQGEFTDIYKHKDRLLLAKIYEVKQPLQDSGKFQAVYSELDKSFNDIIFNEYLEVLYNKYNVKVFYDKNNIN